MPLPKLPIDEQIVVEYATELLTIHNADGHLYLLVVGLPVNQPLWHQTRAGQGVKHAASSKHSSTKPVGAGQVILKG